MVWLGRPCIKNVTRWLCEYISHAYRCEGLDSPTVVRALSTCGVKVLTALFSNVCVNGICLDDAMYVHKVRSGEHIGLLFWVCARRGNMRVNLGAAPGTSCAWCLTTQATFPRRGLEHGGLQVVNLNIDTWDYNCSSQAHFTH